VVSFTTRLLYPQGKSPWYPLGRRLGGPQRWVKSSLINVQFKIRKDYGILMAKSRGEWQGKSPLSKCDSYTNKNCVVTVMCLKVYIYNKVMNNTTFFD
jgi:hypothetical protein